MSEEILSMAFDKSRHQARANDGEDATGHLENCRTAIPAGSSTEDASTLAKAIGVHAVDQETLERDIALEVSRRERLK